jgi:hypothetical protein
MPSLFFFISHDHGLKMGEEGMPQGREVKMDNQEGGDYIGDDDVEGIYGPHATQCLYERMEAFQVPEKYTRYYLSGNKDKHDAEVGHLLHGVKFGLGGGFKGSWITEE